MPYQIGPDYWRPKKDTATDVFKKSLAVAAGQMLFGLPAHALGSAITSSFQPGGGGWQAVTPQETVEAYQQAQAEDLAFKRAGTALAGQQLATSKLTGQKVLQDLALAEEELPYVAPSARAKLQRMEAQTEDLRGRAGLERERMAGTDLRAAKGLQAQREMAAAQIALDMRRLQQADEQFKAQSLARGPGGSNRGAAADAKALTEIREITAQRAEINSGVKTFPDGTTVTYTPQQQATLNAELDKRLTATLWADRAAGGVVHSVYTSKDGKGFDITPFPRGGPLVTPGAGKGPDEEATLKLEALKLEALRLRVEEATRHAENAPGDWKAWRELIAARTAEAVAEKEYAETKTKATESFTGPQGLWGAFKNYGGGGF